MPSGNRTGRYVYDEVSRQVVQVSDEIPTLARPVYAPKGDVPHYDAGLRRRVESKAQKRQILRRHGLREGGLVTNPERQWRDEIASQPSRRPSAEAVARQAQVRQRVQAAGGVLAFRDRLLTGGS